jgi:replication factor A1
VVIWNPASKPELKPGQKVVVTNVKSKRSSSGEFEIHGDAGSAILLGLGDKKEPLLLRVATLYAGPAGTVLLAVDRTKKIRVIEVGKDVGGATKGELVSISPDEESGGRILCRTPGSVEAADESGFPELVELTTKLRDAKDGASRIMVEVIALSNGVVDDVRLKDDSVVAKGELLVGDDTAEMRVIGWREEAEKLSGIQPGERLRIYGVSPKITKLGGWELQLGTLTAIERLRD